MDFGSVLSAFYEGEEWTVTGPEYSDIIWGNWATTIPSEATLRSRYAESLVVLEARQSAPSDPVVDQFLQQSPNGTWWRWTVSNTGSGKWVKVV